MLMTKKQRQARRRSISAKSLESKQYQQKIIPNKKKNNIPNSDFYFDDECGIIDRDNKLRIYSLKKGEDK
jgi:hypothetical protein|tara:strand:- start:444 stop:653 length:210 start_codon:yes stop_codon:yes gene_type:complete